MTHLPPEISAALLAGQAVRFENSGTHAFTLFGREVVPGDGVLVRWDKQKQAYFVKVGRRWRKVARFIMN